MVAARPKQKTQYAKRKKDTLYGRTLSAADAKREEESKREKQTKREREREREEEREEERERASEKDFRVYSSAPAADARRTARLQRRAIISLPRNESFVKAKHAASLASSCISVIHELE